VDSGHYTYDYIANGVGIAGAKGGMDSLDFTHGTANVFFIKHSFCEHIPTLPNKGVGRKFSKGATKKIPKISKNTEK